MANKNFTRKDLSNKIYQNLGFSKNVSSKIIDNFFETARLALPTTPILLGCARPLGAMKIEIDQLAIDAGLNGIAFPSEGIVVYATEKGLDPSFVNACCGVTW